MTAAITTTHVDVSFDRAARTATLTVRAPQGQQPKTVDQITLAGDEWWPLAMARELDDAILMLRVNEPELGLLLLKTAGDPQAVLAARCGDAGASRPLAGAGDDCDVAADARAAGGFLAQHVCAD